MTPRLAIDPGASGALAWTDRDGTVNAEKMPDGLTALVDRLRSLAAELPGLTALVEKVGTYRPGNSGPAACTFARHCGHLESALYALGIPADQVTPSKWMQAALGDLPDDKAERKRTIRDRMARRFPHLTVTMTNADALGLLVFAMMRPPISGPHRADRENAESTIPPTQKE